MVDGVGAAQRALELAVEYAKERVQFDKPIGSFQAVQHLCADMLRAFELGRAAGYYACWAADDAEPAEAHRAAVMAKAFASDAYAQLGGSAIQVFGGIGFTWEHDIHLYYKRLLSLSVVARQLVRTPRRARPHRHRLTAPTGGRNLSSKSQKWVLDAHSASKAGDARARLAPSPRPCAGSLHHLLVGEPPEGPAGISRARSLGALSAARWRRVAWLPCPSTSMAMRCSTYAKSIS